jgi:hypothetical protein
MQSATKSTRYCEACQATPRCRTCEKVGGGHLAWCTWSQPSRRPVPTYQGRVSVEAFLDLYTAHRAEAVRMAARIAGDAAAEDAVHDAVAYLWSRRETLEHFDVHLLMTSVKHKALALRTCAWAKHVLLGNVEALMLAQRHLAHHGGRRSDSEGSLT